ncbi:Fibrocystin-L [Lamellibrachia satsuma]|nr:Fibrocystin-L [Lamellibrachia satsuma]
MMSDPRFIILLFPCNKHRIRCFITLAAQNTWGKTANRKRYKAASPDTFAETERKKYVIGTEEEPFQHKGIITMYGQVRSPELPVYGAKTLAVRHGALELHGKPTPVTWTVLAETVAVGATEIKLQIPVTWSVGDEIIIASTGGHTSQKGE